MDRRIRNALSLIGAFNFKELSRELSEEEKLYLIKASLEGKDVNIEGHRGSEFSSWYFQIYVGTKIYKAFYGGGNNEDEQFIARNNTPVLEIKDGVLYLDGNKLVSVYKFNIHKDIENGNELSKVDLSMYVDIKGLDI